MNDSFHWKRSFNDRFDTEASARYSATIGYPENDHMPLLSVSCLIRASRFTLAAVFIGFLAGVLWPAIAAASPRLRCHLSQSDTVQVLEFMPVLNPYDVKAIDLNGRFRFKAVVIGDERKIEYIKLYIYYQSVRQAVLLHEAKYLTPIAGTGANSAALTGMNTLYSPDLGRELQYGCALVEATP